MLRKIIQRIASFNFSLKNIRDKEKSNGVI